VLHPGRMSSSPQQAEHFQPTIISSALELNLPSWLPPLARDAGGYIVPDSADHVIMGPRLLVSGAAHPWLTLKAASSALPTNADEWLDPAPLRG